MQEFKLGEAFKALEKPKPVVAEPQQADAVTYVDVVGNPLSAIKLPGRVKVGLRRVWNPGGNSLTPVMRDHRRRWVPAPTGLGAQLETLRASYPDAMWRKWPAKRLAYMFTIDVGTLKVYAKLEQSGKNVTKYVGTAIGAVTSRDLADTFRGVR